MVWLIGLKGGIMNKKEINIVYKSVDELIPYVNNPRDNANAVDAVASSIKNFGFKVPIVIDKGNEIVTGHTRLLAAKKLGMDKVPVIIADDLSEAEVKAFRLADNKVGELADWDFEALELELEELEGSDLFTGFEEFEINSLTSAVDVDKFFEDAGEHHSEPKLITCPHCGETFEK